MAGIRVSHEMSRPHEIEASTGMYYGIRYCGHARVGRHWDTAFQPGLTMRARLGFMLHKSPKQAIKQQRLPETLFIHERIYYKKFFRVVRVRVRVRVRGPGSGSGYAVKNFLENSIKI